MRWRLLSCAHDAFCPSAATGATRSRCGDMNLKPALIGAIVGAIVTRARTPWGPVVGGVLGALLLERLFPQLREMPKAAFTEPLFELAGGIAKADGEVSEVEVAMATQWFDRLGLDAVLRKRAIAAFERGRTEGWRFEPACDSLRTYTHREQDLRLMVLTLLADLAAVDAHAKARAMLEAIAERINVARPTLDGLLDGERMARLAADYAELQVSTDASDEEVKAAYRTLVARHHPDRLPHTANAAARRAASERTASINAAYARIQRARGMN